MDKKMKMLGILAGVKLMVAAVLLLLIVSGCEMTIPSYEEPVDTVEDPEEEINTEVIDETLQDLDISDLEDLESELDDLDW